MYPAITPLDVVPYAILVVAWYVVTRELRRGLKDGEMVWFKRGAGGDNLGDDPSPKLCRKQDEPIGYWFLFRFYFLIAILVPIIIVGTILSKMGYLG